MSLEMSFPKAMLKSSGGQYTDTQIDRCAEMSGAFGKEMGRILTSAGVAQAGTPITTTSKPL